MTASLAYQLDELPVGDLFVDGVAQIDWTNRDVWAVSDLVIRHAVDRDGVEHEPDLTAVKAAIYRHEKPFIQEKINEAAAEDEAYEAFRARRMC